MAELTVFPAGYLDLTETSVVPPDHRRELLVVAGFVLTIAAIVAFAFPFASAVSDFGDACVVAVAHYLGPDPVAAGDRPVVCDSPSQLASMWLALGCAVLAAGSGLLLTLAARYPRWPVPAAVAALGSAIVIFAVGSLAIG